MFLMLDTSIGIVIASLGFPIRVPKMRTKITPLPYEEVRVLLYIINKSST